MKPITRDGVVNDIVAFALIALLIILPVRIFIAQPFIVRGASMVPTFQNGEYLIVDQFSYRIHEPERGDVIILRYPKDPDVFFIKRIIGMPGETLELIGNTVIVRNGPGTEPLILDQSYIGEGRLQNEYGVYALDDNEYFVMGDNRNESSDSRSWGPLEREFIVGKAFLRLLPPGRLSFLPGTIITAPVTP